MSRIGCRLLGIAAVLAALTGCSSGGEMTPGPREGAALVMTFVGRSACGPQQESACLEVRVENFGDLGSGWCELRIATAETGVEQILDKERVTIENIDPGEELTAYLQLDPGAVSRMRSDPDVYVGTYCEPGPQL